jgi:Glyoxalase-like domain
VTARLRHIVLATDDLAADVARARDGLGLAPGIRDAEAMRAFDLEHEVLVLGSAYLEILAPLGNRPELPGARFLARGGPGGYMLDLQVPDLDAVLDRAARLGLAPVMRDVYRGNPICQLHPRDFGTLLEVDQIVGPKDWHWDAEFPASLRAVERARPVAAAIAVPEPVAVARRWAEVFGADLGSADLGSADLGSAELGGSSVMLSGVTVSFTKSGDKRGGLWSVDVAVPPDGQAGELEVAGVLFRRHPGMAR